MGYFDAITSGVFKTGSDGRKLFFPWGFLGRGYIIPSEEDFVRLRRIWNIIYIALWLFIFVFLLLHSILGIIISGIIIQVLWVIIVYRNCRSMERTDEKYYFREGSRDKDTVILWWLKIFSMVFFLLVIYIFIEYAEGHLSASVAIPLGIICTILFVIMFKIKRPPN